MTYPCPRCNRDDGYPICAGDERCQRTAPQPMTATDPNHPRRPGDLLAWGSQAVLDVAAERRRQIEVEGWTPEHDDQHGDQSMSIAAACYALADMRAALSVQTVRVDGLWSWTGWALSWFKPKDRRSNLVRAAALLLAEIERLDRAKG